MNKKLMISFLISILLIISIYCFSYATEEGGRFVDIPVPPASSGRTDFTSEQAEEQTKQYEEKQNIIQTNSTTIGEDYILYQESKNENAQNEKNIVKSEQYTNISENMTEPRKENNVDGYQNENNEEINENIEEVNENIENKDFKEKKINSKIALICGAILIVIIIFVVCLIIKKNNRKHNKRRK